MLIVELCASLEENKLKLLTRSTDYWLKKSHGIYRQIMPDVFVALFSIKIPNDSLWGRLDTIRYDTRCYFNVRSKADISQLNLPHGTDN